MGPRTPYQGGEAQTADSSKGGKRLEDWRERDSGRCVERDSERCVERGRRRGRGKIYRHLPFAICTLNGQTERERVQCIINRQVLTLAAGFIPQRDRPSVTNPQSSIKSQSQQTAMIWRRASNRPRHWVRTFPLKRPDPTRRDTRLAETDTGPGGDASTQFIPLAKKLKVKPTSTET